MYEYFPLLVVGGAVGIFSLIFLIAYLSIKDKKEAMGFDRNMKDGEITKRLLAYAKPYWRNFVLVILVMAVSIAYDIFAPWLMGQIVANVESQTEYEITLEPDAYALAENGEMTIDIRLLDEKQQKIAEGAAVIFKNGGDPTASFKVKVTKLHVFGTFEELYGALPLDRCGYTAKTVLQADPSDMDERYSPEKQRNYDAVGMEFAHWTEADDLLAEDSKDAGVRRLLIMVGIYASILVISMISSYVQAIVLQRTGQKIVSTIREDLFSHIENLSHSQLNNIPVGKLVTRVTNDTNSVSMMFTNIIVNLVKNCFVIIGVLAAMLVLNYMLTLMILCFVPFIVLFTMLFRKFSRRAYRRVKDRTTDINTFLSEHLSGMKIIQIFNREQQKKEEFDGKNWDLGKAKHRQIFVFGIFRPLVYMLYISSVMCLFYLGGRGVIKDVEFLGQTVDVSIIVAFYMYVSKFFNPIQSLAEQFNWLQSAFASAEKIFTIMDIVPEVQDDPDAIELEEVKGNIEFRNVWFAYVPGEWVLKDVSFTVHEEETVAFVGSTGSGKTTILSLICRNYDIQKGQILIDGIDIKKIKLSSLRSHFGQMLQDVFLFSGTIRSNIVLREEGISDEEIMQVCRYVNADHFIDKLKDGLDEEVRERGNNFSAGQRQLLSFARTIIHKPSVIILDEATANIDTETELLIQNSLEKMMNFSTMLIVAHRLSTIQHADQIIVLSHGEIVERGNHFELLEQKGRYYRLFKLQYQNSNQPKS